METTERSRDTSRGSRVIVRWDGSDGEARECRQGECSWAVLVLREKRKTKEEGGGGERGADNVVLR